MTDAQILSLAKDMDMIDTDQRLLDFARALFSSSSKAEKPKCPHCQLTDIEHLRVCHNSACSAYAREESFYCGWK